MSCRAPKACSQIIPRTESATALPKRWSGPPCSKVAVTRRQYCPAATALASSAPAAMMASRDFVAPTASSTAKTTTSTRMSPIVTGGARRMRRSKSTRRPRSMSGVMRSGCSASSVIGRRGGARRLERAASPALARVEHYAERQRDATVEVTLGVAGEVQRVAVEQRELAVELAERRPGEGAVRVHEDEVRAQDAE